MLTQLFIKNIGLISQLEIDFENGMTVITGETGAGKSMIISAIELALGQRSNINQADNQRSEIILAFDIRNQPNIKALLDQHQLNQDDHCLIRRSIDANARSKCYINDTPVSLQKIKTLAEMLISIHGQHQHQALFSQDYQRQLLDAYAGHQILVDQVDQSFKQWQKLKQQFDSLKLNNQDNEQRIDFLRYQLQELAELKLTEDEIIALENEHKKLAHADDLIQAGQSAASAVYDHEQSAQAQLNHAYKQLEQSRQLDPRINNALQSLNNAIIEIQEAQTEIKDFLSEIDTDPQQLQQLEQLLGHIHSIARKHKLEPMQLPTHYQQLTKQLDQLENYDHRLHQLQQQQDKAMRAYQTKAKKLSDSRHRASKQLAQLVSKNMQALSIKQGQFAIELITQTQASRHGQEKIQFLVSTNSGQKLQAMNKIASGGELSRISLAIQVITAKKYVIPTLVFDEIDVGIGGSTAEIVGKLLVQLSHNTQILTITHLGQVASKGKQHLLVDKQQQQQQTDIQLRYLKQNEKIDELARMIGGINITEQTRAHAKEMLEQASS